MTRRRPWLTTANTFFLLSLLTLLTVVAVFGMRYFSAARQAAARLAGDADHRLLATQATVAQAESAASLKAELAEIRARLTSIEKVLKQVE
jgi:ABC-type phosphate transport system auxiliary subunit